MAKGKVVCDPDCFYAGYRADTGEHLLEDGYAFRQTVGRGGTAFVVIHFDGRGALGLETHVDIEDVEKTAQ